MRTFPFIKPYSGDRSFSSFHSVPDFYYAREKITGLLYTAPFLLLALIPASMLGIKFLGKNFKDSLAGDSTDQNSLTWISITLIGAAFVSFVTIMIYFYCTTRFVADFTPALTLLALIGFWQGYQFVSRWRMLQIPCSILVVILAGGTIIISTLLAISGYKERFTELNPALMHNLFLFFSQ